MWNLRWVEQRSHAAARIRDQQRPAHRRRLLARDERDPRAGPHAGGLTGAKTATGQEAPVDGRQVAIHVAIRERRQWLLGRNLGRFWRNGGRWPGENSCRGRQSRAWRQWLTWRAARSGGCVAAWRLESGGCLS